MSVELRKDNLVLVFLGERNFSSFDKYSTVFYPSVGSFSNGSIDSIFFSRSRPSPDFVHVILNRFQEMPLL